MYKLSEPQSPDATDDSNVAELQTRIDTLLAEKAEQEQQIEELRKKVCRTSIITVLMPKF